MRRLAVTFIVAVSVAALASLAPGSPLPSACAAAGSHHAALVVEHGDGSVVSRCVAFDASQVTGVELLNASGIAWSGQTFGGFGEAVCAMDGEPARYSSCPGADGYWAVFVVRGGGAWQLSNVGISTLMVADGDAEGFRFVPSSGNPAAPPLPVGICAPASSAPAATGTATATPTAAAPATATPANTPTPAAAAVVAPTVRPTAATSDVAGPGSIASSSPSPISSATAAIAGVTASFAPVASAGIVPGYDAPAPAPGSAPGPDLGLLAAALAGGGLGGLALLRLIAVRRSVR